jgi:hypothetical protein
MAVKTVASNKEYKMRKLMAILIVLAFSLAAYAEEKYVNGVANQSVYIVLYDRNGDPNTSINVTTLQLSYATDQNSLVGPEDGIDLGAENAAHTDWGVYELGTLGEYRFDFPDAAFRAGIDKHVHFQVDDTVTGTRTGYLTIRLEAPGLTKTALDNLELMFNGTGYAGGTAKLGVDVVVWDGNSTDPDRFHSVFGATPFAAAWDGDPNYYWNTRIMYVSAGSNAMTGPDVTAAVPTTENIWTYTDRHLKGDSNSTGAYTAAVAAQTAAENLVSVGYIKNLIFGKDANGVTADVWIDTKAGYLDMAISDVNGGSAGAYIYALDTTVAAGSTTSTFTLTAGIQNDDAYNWCIISIKDANDDHYEIRYVVDYAGTTRTITVDLPFTFTPAASDIVHILETAYIRNPFKGWPYGF